MVAIAHPYDSEWERVDRYMESMEVLQGAHRGVPGENWIAQTCDDVLEAVSSALLNKAYGKRDTEAMRLIGDWFEFGLNYLTIEIGQRLLEVENDNTA